MVQKGFNCSSHPTRRLLADYLKTLDSTFLSRRRLEGGLLGGHVRVMRLVTDFLVDDSEELWLSNCPSMNAISIPRSSGGVARRAAGLKRGEANREDAGGGERYDQEDDENDPRGSSNVCAALPPAPFSHINQT
jgi:hypothetical protein